MYREFLETILAYISALNGACEEIDEKAGLTPYVQRVPVLLDGELCGFLVDEIEGSYSYAEATDEERTWWNEAPWNRK